jgi:hypothetical protein
MNRGGDSGIAAYEIGDDSITVQFSDGAVYLYTSQSAGAIALAEMQHLARAGRGLNGYIRRVVRKGYAQRLR